MLSFALETSTINPLDAITFSLLIFIDRGYLEFFVLPRFKGFQTDQRAGSSKSNSAEALESLCYSFSHLRPFLVYFHLSNKTYLFLSALTRTKTVQCGFTSLKKNWVHPHIILMAISQHYLTAVVFCSRAMFTTISDGFVLKTVKVEVYEEKNPG